MYSSIYTIDRSSTVELYTSDCVSNISSISTVLVVECKVTPILPILVMVE
jgi:hypothetical protein